MRTAGTSDVLEYRRRLAVKRVQQGYSTEEVSDFLDVHPSSVRRWVATAQRLGDAGLEARPVPGRPAKLTGAQERIALRWLADSPTAHGFSTELWTAGRLAQLIDEEWGIEFHEHYLCAWLRQRGYTPQMPRLVPRERNDEAIARWLARDWPRIKRKAWRLGACLMLLDESGLLMAPLLRRSWSLRGHPPALEHKAGHREKVSVAAALYLTPPRDRLSMAFETLVNGYFNNERVAEFLSGALQWRTEPLVVAWDGGSMHKGGPINDLAAEWPGRLQLEPLPAHASTLMPVEFLWRWLKHDCLCNFAPRDANHLNEAVVRELEPIRDDQNLLQHFFLQSDLPLPRALLT